MWETKIIDGRCCKAKIYDYPSRHGINSGRISKLTICIGDTWEGMGKGKTIYHFDRGLEFDDTPTGLLDKVLVAFCN